MGASERRKGIKNELDAVNWLRAHGYPDARRYLSGDGRQPGDIDGVPGVVIDVKARDELSIPEALRQVQKESDNGVRGLPVVWMHLRGVGDPGQWVVMIRAEDFFEWIYEATT